MRRNSAILGVAVCCQSVGSVLLACTPSAVPVLVGDVRRPDIEAAPEAEPGFEEPSSEGPALEKKLRWLEDDRLQVARDHIFDPMAKCLVMPHRGQSVRVCENLWKRSEPRKSYDVPASAIANEGLPMIAFLVDDLFCVADDDTLDCYEIPVLGVPDALQKHPLYRFLSSAEWIYVPSDADLAGTEARVPSSCLKFRVEVDPLWGNLTLYGSKEPEEDRFVQDVYRVFPRDDGVTIHHGGRTLSAKGDVLVTGGMMCHAILATTAHETKDGIRLEHGSKVRRWYRQEAVCRERSAPVVAAVMGRCGEH